MLQVNLAFPDFHNEQIIRLNCIRFGHVRSIKIHLSPSAHAAIQMEDHAQANELVSRFGGSAIGNYALVHLNQKSDNAIAA